MIYDVIILGGGIAGLYTAYLLTTKMPKMKILVLEKESYLGGRVITYRNKKMQVEVGAGRYSETHTLVRGLIHKLRLDKYESPMSSDSIFIRSKTREEMNSIIDAPSNLNHDAKLATQIMLGQPQLLSRVDQPAVQIGLDSVFGEKTQPATMLITRVLVASKLESDDVLRNMTFLDYATRVLKNREEVKFIEDSFGYYSELVVMNAYDACKLLGELNPANQFYGLSCGLDMIIKKLTSVLKKRGVTIKTSKTVEDVKWTLMTKSNINGKTKKCGGFFWNNKTRKYVLPPLTTGNKHKIICTDGTVYWGTRCVCTLPKNAIEKLKVFEPLKPMFNKIACGSLCRIYMRFAPDKDTGKMWFADIPKCTTDNELRMIIPINVNAGTIMISYSDNVYADYWKKIYEKDGEKGIEKEIGNKIYETLGVKMPKPEITKVFHWKCGVGYWGVGANSKLISDRLVKPYSEQELYICGESYSETGQQWMEGSLEMSVRVVERIFLDE